MTDSVIPWTVALQVPLSMGFSRQEYWSGLLSPSPGDLPDPGVKLDLLHWQVDSLPLSHPYNLYSLPNMQIFPNPGIFPYPTVLLKQGHSSLITQGSPNSEL